MCHDPNAAVARFASFTGDPAFTAKKTPWIDLTFDFSGALARQAQHRFDQDWIFATQAPQSDAPLSEVQAPASDATGAQLIASGPDQVDVFHDAIQNRQGALVAAPDVPQFGAESHGEDPP